MTGPNRILAADIGGTKTILGLYSGGFQNLQPQVEKTYRSGSHANLESILRDFREQYPEPVLAASFAVAGPVRLGRAQVTNLPWLLDAAKIEREFGIGRVSLWNDLEALAASVPHLPAGSLHTLWNGQPFQHGAIAVLAPGTGLGQAFLVWNGSSYTAYPSEGGHTDFAPFDRLSSRLLDFMWRQLPHVSVERVCSGSGLPDLYRFLRDVEGIEEDSGFADSLARAKDPTAHIVNAGAKGGNPLCTRTVEFFVQILGAEAGNLALKTLSTGGLYLGGGMSPRILPYLDSELFRNAFLAKGRFREHLAEMPIHVILDPRAVLHGAALLSRPTS